MKISTLALLTALLFTPICGLAGQSAPQSNDIQMELAKENQFVVKLMDVFNISGKKIPQLIELDSIDLKQKKMVFKSSGKKLRRISIGDIKEIIFTRLRQGILTGKSPSLRVIVWNGDIRNLEINYRDVKIKNGYLYLDQTEFAKYFDDSDALKANSNEWSDPFNNFWIRKKEESPDVFSANFAFKDGRGSISRKMATEYCKACLKIEILNLKINPDKETLLIRCKSVFYDRYNE